MGVFDELARQLRLPIRVRDGAGFRPAQVAAINAINAHFWDKTRPALVVMPTGSGKTAVMMAAGIALRSSRILVVAPSRLLREQLLEKFTVLDPLRELGAVEATALAPRVFEVKNKLATKKQWAALREYDVVVGTPMTLSPELSGVAEPPPDLFDTILFDEAHHVAAPSYAAIAGAFPGAKQVLFTATPFRRDKREIKGDLVLTYELARARLDGIYGDLHFCPVEPSRGQTNDEAIARAAAAQLQADRKKGLDHRLVVRADGRERADDLAELYQQCTKLNLQRVHSGLGAKFVRKTIDALKEGTIDGVIAVDMLGEGFDLPNLKVAALHTPHKSLAITLQFIGRFARTTAKNLGQATFFAIPSEVTGEAERLFVPGAEWNEIVEDLSRNRISVEKETREVIAGFSSLPDAEPMSPDQQEFLRAQLWSLRPFVHAKVYEVNGVIDLAVNLSLPRGVRSLLTQHNEKENVLVCLGQQRARNRWSLSDVLSDVTHDLFLVAHIPDERFVFVCTTRRENSVYDALIESVAGNLYRRLAPDEVNRVLNGLDGVKIFGLGMRNRAGAAGGGGESYRTLTGQSADVGVRAMDAARYDQGHAFCSGTEGGKSTVVGFSTGSKIWSNRYVPVGALLRWFRAAAKKLRDTRLKQPRTMFDKLGVASRITVLPSLVVAADLPPEAYAKTSSHVKSGARSAWLPDLRIEIGAQTNTTVELTVASGSLSIPLKYDLTQNAHISGRSAAAKSAVLLGASDRGDDLFVAFLNEHSPILFLEDLSSVVGDTISEPPAGDATTIKDQIEPVDWEALGIDPHTEKPTGRRRPGSLKSLFEYVEERLEGEGASIVFLDDSSNEIADYVGVISAHDRVRVQLIHCKAAKKPKPGAKGRAVPNERVGDLYEVLGQSVKCRRWLDSSRLISQVERRLVTAEQSRFVTGNLNGLKAALSDVTRVVFEVVVIQPAISTEPKDTVADLLAAADGYQQGLALRFVGTAPARVAPPR